MDIDLIKLIKDSSLKDQRIAKLEKKLAELKANAILPKFKVGDEIWAVVSYITESEDDIYNNVIETGIVQKIEIDKREIKYWCDNGRIYWEDEFVKLFATKEEAQQKLKELESL